MIGKRLPFGHSGNGGNTDEVQDGLFRIRPTKESKIKRTIWNRVVQAILSHFLTVALSNSSLRMLSCLTKLLSLVRRHCSSKR